MGPPTAPLASLRRNSGLAVPARLRKNSLAFIDSCWNAYRPVPLKRLVPWRVTMSMLPPPLRPWAAEVSDVDTSISSSASSGTPRLPPRPPDALSMLVVSMPFTRSALLVGRAPLTLGFSVCEPSSPCAPGSVARFRLRPVRSGSGADTPASATITCV